MFYILNLFVKSFFRAILDCKRNAKLLCIVTFMDTVERKTYSSTAAKIKEKNWIPG